MNVLIVVTHLLGSGHLARALTLGRAFVQAGHRVRIASGGCALPHLGGQSATGPMAGADREPELVQLPPLRSDGVNFSRLLDGDGQEADAAYMALRRAQLLSLLCDDDMPVDLLITELFPFGRRSLSAEFSALLEAAHALPRPPRVLASVRDILAPPSKPAKAEAAAQLIERYYDGVLVHSDPRAVRLDASWPVTPPLEARLFYTGYVAPPPPWPHPDGIGTGEILVSAGGGNVGEALYGCAVAAAALRPNWRWRLLVGGSDADLRVAALHATAPVGSANLLIEPARPDFRQMLPLAAASVSLCGYNTALDILQAGTPALFVPFDAGQEVEQSLRASSLASLAGIEMARQQQLTPARLCTLVEQLRAAPRRPTDGFRFDGAARSVEIAAKLLKEGA